MQNCIARGEGNGGAKCEVWANDESEVDMYVTVWAKGKTLIRKGKLNKQYGNHIELRLLGSSIMVDCGNSHWKLDLP